MANFTQTTPPKMQFRTEITVPEFPFKIDHRQYILPLGSCFSEHMAERLKKNLLHTVENPFGTSYNPVSLAQQIDHIRTGKPYTSADLTRIDHRVFSFDHYTAFSGVNEELTLRQMNHALQSAHHALYQTGLLMITLGTAHAWKLKNGRIVNNCHRLPAAQFNRVLLSTDEIVYNLSAALQKLLDDFPKISVVVTVSPVRHLRDGAVANQLSKSTLLVATHQLINSINRVHYFPAYELMVDDLRDYRFYQKDMLHPNSQAVDYIWEKFNSAIFSDQTQQMLREIRTVVHYCNHHPVNPNSAENIAGAQKMLEKLRQMEQKWPDANWLKCEGILHDRTQGA